MELAPGTRIDERYDVQGHLGRGGIASVYLARHVELGTLHAIKIVELPSEELRARLLEEGRCQGSLHHPNVLNVTDLVHVGGSPGLVLEYVNGPTLGSLLASRRLQIAEVDHLARAIVAGVNAAHRHGLVHRDLKPDNILVATIDGAPVPKIADFGLAKVIGGRKRGRGWTKTAVAMGTPGYMAPEQIEDSGRVDARADLFALGAILYEMVAGRRAFSGGLVETLRLTQAGQFVALEQLIPDVPARMRDTIVRALRVEPDERFADCAALARAWAGDDHEPLPVAWTGWMPTSSETHPSLEQLVDAEDSVVVEHLASCAACRVEVELYRDAFLTWDGALELTTDNPKTSWSSPWREVGMSALAGVASLPFVFGSLVLLLGDGQVSDVIGPTATPLIGLTALVTSVSTYLTLRLRRGLAGGVATGLIPYAMIAALGLWGSFASFGNLNAALERASAATRGLLAVNGGQIALGAQAAGWTLAAVSLLLASAGAVWAYWGEGPDRPSRIAALTGLVLGVGTLMWGIDATLRHYTPVPFVVLLAFVASAICCGLVSSPTPNRRAASVATGRAWGCAMGATAAAAFAGHAAHQREVLIGLLDILPADRLDAAALVATTVERASWMGVGGWLGAIVAVVCLAGVRGHGPRPGHLQWGRELAVFVVVLGLVSGGMLSSQVGQQRTASMIKPAFLAAAARWYVPGLELEASSGGNGLTVVVHSDGVLLPGDQISAVSSRIVDDAQGLLSGLRGCLCVEGARPASCALLDDCLAPGDDLNLTVIRQLDGQRRAVDVTVRSGLGDR